MKKYITLFMMFFSINLFAAENSLTNIQLKDLNQNLINLDQYKGKNVYIKMWASWCPICLSGLHEIDQLSANVNQDFTVITIVSPGQKGEKNTKEFIEWYNGLEYKNILVLLDEQGEIMKKAKVRGYPFNLFLDSHLELKKSIPGHLTPQQITQLVQE